MIPMARFTFTTEQQTARRQLPRLRGGGYTVHPRSVLMAAISSTKVRTAAAATSLSTEQILRIRPTIMFKHRSLLVGPPLSTVTAVRSLPDKQTATSQYMVCRGILRA